MSDNVAIVTAAGRGIGAACARELAARGYRVALLARSDEVVSLAKELGGLAVQGSVAEPKDLERLVTATLDRFGRVDCVVNNTGHATKGPLLGLTDADWHQGLDLLMLNVVRMARLVTPCFLKQGGGVFVNVSSFGAVEPSASFPVSSALRAALSAFTKMYADQHAKAGIRMNCVLPGFVDSYPAKEEIQRSIPAGRYARAEEIGRAVAFLASDDAAYITGQALRVDGGLTRSL